MGIKGNNFSHNWVCVNLLMVLSFDRLRASLGGIYLPSFLFNSLTRIEWDQYVFDTGTSHHTFQSTHLRRCRFYRLYFLLVHFGCVIWCLYFLIISATLFSIGDLLYAMFRMRIYSSLRISLFLLKTHTNYGKLMACTTVLVYQLLSCQ